MKMKQDYIYTEFRRLERLNCNEIKSTQVSDYIFIWKDVEIPILDSKSANLVPDYQNPALHPKMFNILNLFSGLCSLFPDSLTFCLCKL